MFASRQAKVASRVKKHLEFLGYEVRRHTGGALVGEGGPLPHIVVALFEDGNGMILNSAFQTASLAQSNRQGFIEFLNRLNCDLSFTKCFVDENGDFNLHAVVVGDYEKKRMAINN